MSNHIFIFVFIVSVLLYTGCSQVKEDPYHAEIKQLREETEAFMKNSPESPFHKKGDLEFEGLKYYTIDPKFKINAIIHPIASPEPVDIKMSDGSQVRYFRYALAEFSLDNISHKLVLLKSEEYWDQNWLFLPFYDETSAIDTYGGGRFLEVTYSGGDQATIDFNKSYNPYCAYNTDYKCPIPPAENRLSFKITAGEKIYKEHH